MMFPKVAVALAAPLLLAAAWAPAAQAQPGMLGQTVLIHGNYCGPGNNAPLPPVDALDAACARHDACTPSTGLPAKECNLRLQREAEAIARDPRQTDDLRAMAGFVAAFAAANPSDTQPDVDTRAVKDTALRMISSALR